jgi:hypothetical protein
MGVRMADEPRGVGEAHSKSLAVHHCHSTATATTTPPRKKFTFRPARGADNAYPSRPTNYHTHSRSRSRACSRRRGRSPTVRKNVNAEPLPVFDEFWNKSVKPKIRNNTKDEQWDKDLWTSSTAFASAQPASPTSVMHTSLIFDEVYSDILERRDDDTHQHSFKECKDVEEVEVDDVGDQNDEELPEYEQLLPSASSSYGEAPAAGSSADKNNLNTNCSSQQLLQQPHKKKKMIGTKTMAAPTGAAIIDEILNEAEEESSSQEEWASHNLEEEEHGNHPGISAPDDDHPEAVEEVQFNNGVGKKGCWKEKRERAIDGQDDDDEEEAEYLQYLMQVDGQYMYPPPDAGNVAPSQSKSQLQLKLLQLQFDTDSEGVASFAPPAIRRISVVSSSSSEGNDNGSTSSTLETHLSASSSSWEPVLDHDAITIMMITSSAVRRVYEQKIFS